MQEKRKKMRERTWALSTLKNNIKGGVHKARSIVMAKIESLWRWARKVWRRKACPRVEMNTEKRRLDLTDCWCSIPE